MALTTSQLLGLIIVVIIVILVVLAIFNPAILFGQGVKQQMSFRDFCIQWSLFNYKEDKGDPVYRPYPPVEGQIPIGVPEDYCGPALGKLPGTLTQLDIDNCKDVCRLKK